MFNLDLSYSWLYWTRPVSPPPVPEHLRRTFIQTPSGALELLSNTPAKAHGPPILFCHGGMGGAWVWNEYMVYLADQGVQAYAISLRGHGGSWYPSFFRMVFATPRRVLGDDLVAAVDWVNAKHGNVVLVGHSAGGGLLQDVLARARVMGIGLGLLGTIPGFGSLKVNSNWLSFDSWFNFRLLLHGLHPNSPVSCPQLTQRAFFGDRFPLASVVPFQEQMCRFESYQWAFSMLLAFVKAEDVLAGLTAKAGRILVMAGEQDRLMTTQVTRETVAWYRTASDEDAVHIEFVPSAGHHLQNDVNWRNGAEKLLTWYRGLA